MSAIMPDLTFFDISNKNFWDKEILEKIDACLRAVRESGGHSSEEPCLQTFLMDFASAKNNFIAKTRNIRLIMNCRTKADNNSNFGGQQCAEFMKEIQQACDKYLNNSIYSDNKDENLPSNIIKKIRNMAQKSETVAWNFENKAKQEYLNTGKDNTLEIFVKSGYNELI